MAKYRIVRVDSVNFHSKTRTTYKVQKKYLGLFWLTYRGLYVSRGEDRTLKTIDDYYGGPDIAEQCLKDFLEYKAKDKAWSRQRPKTTVIKNIEI